MQLPGTERYQYTKFSIDPRTFFKNETNLIIEKEVENEVLVDLTKNMAVSENFWKYCFDRISIQSVSRGELKSKGPLNQTVIQVDHCKGELLRIDYQFHGTIGRKERAIAISQNSQACKASTTLTKKELTNQTQTIMKKTKALLS